MKFQSDMLILVIGTGKWTDWSTWQFCPTSYCVVSKLNESHNHVISRTKNAVHSFQLPNHYWHQIWNYFSYKHKSSFFIND